MLDIIKCRVLIEHEFRHNAELLGHETAEFAADCTLIVVNDLHCSFCLG